MSIGTCSTSSNSEPAIRSQAFHDGLITLQLRLNDTSLPSRACDSNVVLASDYVSARPELLRRNVAHEAQKTWHVH